MIKESLSFEINFYIYKITLQLNLIFKQVERIGHLEIRVIGKQGELDLSPDNYDIRDVLSILENADKLLFPALKKERPLISYKIETGSVRHILQTSLQAIIGFNALIQEINNKESIDFVESPTAIAIETIQDNAIKRNYAFEISTSIENSHTLKINPSTHFKRTENCWLDAEFYYYGQIVNAGGKTNSNIHLATDTGTIMVDTPKDFLEALDKNLLYKSYGLRVSGKQNRDTAEVDKSSFRFLELIDYHPNYNESYINKLISQAKSNWKDIDPDEWISELRGDYDK